MPFEQIIVPNIAAAAASQLRQLIATDVLRPGDQLPAERDLAQKMGISRTSLRAALQTLVAEGLIESKHGTGLFVQNRIGASIADPLLMLIESSPTAVTDYFEFRSILEGESAAIVAQNATSVEKDHIRSVHHLMTMAVENEDTGQMIRLDREFHMAIIEATGNIVSIQLARSLSDLLHASVTRSHNVAYGDSGKHGDLLTQHQRIVDAIDANDAVGARREMRGHLHHFSDLIRRQNDALKRQRTAEKRLKWEAQ